jgi:hypothetical protein
VERARRQSRPLRLLAFYALVEAGIGVYALLFPLLFSAAQYLSLLSPVDHDALGFAFDVALSALLIGPPAVLMGGTIPILTLALAGDLEHATRVHAWIYGANTLGAFAGALAGGFFLVALLGLDGVVLTMGCVNLLAAAGFFGLERRAARIAPDLTQPVQAEPVPRFVAWAAVALLAGFMMALQTTLNRLGALAFGSSQFTFAMVVAVFVLCIAPWWWPSSCCASRSGVWRSRRCRGSRPDSPSAARGCWSRCSFRSTSRCRTSPTGPT